MKLRAFERFREAIIPRFADCPWIRVIDDEVSDSESNLARLSIIAFQVVVQDQEGRKSVLQQSGCQHFYRLLNRPLQALGDNPGWHDQAAAAPQCHIGQPVMLSSGQRSLAFLRLVLGARFFNMIGYSGEGAFEAALIAEISDASRVLDKIELLASQWWRFEPL